MVEKFLRPFLLYIPIIIIMFLSCQLSTSKIKLKKDQDMVKLVQDLVLFLSQDMLSVDDVIQKMGTMKRDPGVPMPIEISTPIMGVRSANLARFPDSGLPYLLSIQLEPIADLTLAKLKAVFGKYQQIRTDRGLPLEFVFSPVLKEKKWQVVILVRLAKNYNDLEDSAIIGIEFRRDAINL